jgi:hypothetical protein
MANFLINSPSSETVGTNSNDLFLLQTLQGNTVYGLEGNDTITASVASAASAVLLNAGAGNDLFLLTGGSTFEGNVFAGSGNDNLELGKNFSASNVRGGSGNDTIEIVEGNLAKTTVNGNDNADVISAALQGGANGVVSAFIGAGKGKDTLSFSLVSGTNALTVAGGEGHDSIVYSASAVGSQSALKVLGGDGYDTITFNSIAASGISSNANIDGGSLNDLITFEGIVDVGAGSATIQGGAGADTIRFLGATAAIAGGYINAGEGLDSVYISGYFGNGSLNGGAGVDTVSLGSFAISGSNGGLIFGDDGGDIINLNSASFQATVTGSGGPVITVTGGGSVLGYASFDQSNLSSFDTVSATVTITSAGATITGTYAANVFNIRQDVVSASVANGIAVSTFTATNGAATFTSTFDNTLTARVVELDRVLTSGQSVAFSNGQGTARYVFIQGGAAASGTAGDLVVKVTSADILAGGGSALIVQKTTTFS